MMKPKLIAGITVRLISGDKRFSDSEQNIKFFRNMASKCKSKLSFFLPTRF